MSSVGYVEGAGDDVPKALQALGLNVERIDPTTAQGPDLERFDAIVTGIRAFNAVPAMARLNPILLAYVENGGTLVVQYNTASRDMALDPRTIGPLSLRVDARARDRGGGSGHLPRAPSIR